MNKDKLDQIIEKFSKALSIKFLKFILFIFKWSIYIFQEYLSFKCFKFLYNKFIKKPIWALMICSESHWSGGCDEIKYKLTDYEDQITCMEKGILLNQGEGFEYGLNCHTEYRINVCETISNETGCN
ncbi:hypothetical protein ND816_17965 [Leptospira levettii]|uniref:hypothetical protein n=1 Tax=Leptospira levettii TaxID=2023178 RepID=UPI00223D046F|nr:hypothetical protein [Leptospira levettii]MCW7509737.1 hypothetical protein [Leptospira levettii]MCW7520824.1 hypothetical protein [Leptospira levettii]